MTEIRYDLDDDIEFIKDCPVCKAQGSLRDHYPVEVDTSHVGYECIDCGAAFILRFKLVRDY